MSPKNPSEAGRRGGRPRKKKAKQETALVVASPEILPPLRQPNQAELLRQLVQEQIAEALVQKDGLLWEPWFRYRQEAYEIRRLQTVPQQRKMAAYYEYFGCLICGEKERPHAGNACCPRCRGTRDKRFRWIEKRLTAPAPEQAGKA